MPGSCYPLDKGRYEVMLELYNAGSAPADVELQLLGERMRMISRR